MKAKILLFIGFLVIAKIQAQIVEPSAGVNKHILQIEVEGQYSIQKEDNTTLKAWSIPSVLLRYGLFKGFELQLNAPLIKEELFEDDHLVHSLNKFDHIQFGFSIDLWKQNKIIPQAALMARVIVPFKANTNSYFNEIGSILSLNLSNAISNKLSLNYNIGHVYLTNGVHAGYYIINLDYTLNSKFHFFLENFADFDNSIFSQNLNAGLGYIFNNSMALDYSIATGLNHNLFYTGLIFTWAINTKKN